MSVSDSEFPLKEFDASDHNLQVFFFHSFISLSRSCSIFGFCILILFGYIFSLLLAIFHPTEGVSAETRTARD